VNTPNKPWSKRSIIKVMGKSFFQPFEGEIGCARIQKCRGLKKGKDRKLQISDKGHYECPKF